MTISVKIPQKFLKLLPCKKEYSLKEVFNVCFSVEEKNDLLIEKLKKIEEKGGFKELKTAEEMLAW